MGNHSEPRHSSPPGFVQTLEKAALPAALIIIVGVIALVSPVLRSSEPPVAGTVTAADTPTDAAPAPQAKEQKRAATDLAFKAEIVPATAFVRTPEPEIPERFVRFRRGAVVPTQFRVGSFNILGHGHTAPGGNKRGYADSRTRMGWTTGLLRAHDLSVAGFQEFQTEQYYSFNALAGGEYAVYPGAAGGRQGVQNSIVWRRADWALVEAGTTPIPYFDGVRMPMPHVLLRNLHTGQHVWFANYHNPADAHGPAERWRDAATSIQIALFNQLRAESGYPVVVTGDMNERDEYLCRLGSAVGMHSADGGYVDGAGCHLPSPMQVDWVLGTEDLAFSDYLADQGPTASRASDHPLVVASALIAPERVVRKCRARSADSRFVFCPPA